MPSPHLHPMSPDSLRPRPAPQAAAFGTPVQLTAPVQRTVASSLPQLQAAAPLTEASSLREAPLFPADLLPEAPLLSNDLLPEDLLADDLLLFAEDDDDEDENEPDAVPTETMPIPVCVPLYEISLDDIPRAKRKK